MPFTHFGLSGPIILSLSRQVVDVDTGGSTEGFDMATLHHRHS
jgi:predicted flavoprotein YhiN